jgi:hypothetical protein
MLDAIVEIQVEIIVPTLCVGMPLGRSASRKLATQSV